MRRDFACSAIDRASANARSPSLEPSVAITIVSNMSPPRCVALPTPTASAPTAKSTARKCRASRAEGPQRVGKATSTAEGPRRGGQGHVYEGLYPGRGDDVPPDSTTRILGGGASAARREEGDAMPEPAIEIRGLTKSCLL